MALTKQQIDEFRKQYGITTNASVLDTGSQSKTDPNQLSGQALSNFLNDNAPVEKKPLFQRTVEGIADFTGGKKIAQGLAQTIANPFISKQIEETQRLQDEAQSNILQQMKENRASGKDNTGLINALKDLDTEMGVTRQDAEKALNQEGLTAKQVVGDALQLGTTIATVGGIQGAGAKATGVLSKVPGLTKSAPSLTSKLATKVAGQGVGVLAGAGKGALTGVATGATVGALSGTAQGLKADGSAKDILKSSGKGALVGGVAGGVIGGVVGGVSGGLQGRALRKQVLESRTPTGKTPPPGGGTPPSGTPKTPVQQKAIEMAKTQGYDQSDIDFMTTMKPHDKNIALKQIEMAKKAAINKRFIERPIDLVGESFVKRAKDFEVLNIKAGKAVDTTARALKGQTVNATPVREKTLSLLEDIGVSINNDGTPNWSKSIFNKTPELKNKIMKTLSDLPNGEIDAYDLHNFKKSIDEVVDFGIKGEGLKGKSANILKAIRRTADGVLDANFESYNKANTDFKITREVLDQANDLFGKNRGFSKEKGGQIMRAVFSNRDSRGRVLKLLSDFEDIGKGYGLKYKDNLIDQALFTEILEDIYGTQATTSLQGQVARAVQGGGKIIEGIRNPIKGTLELVATGVEKLSGITDENKKKILEALIR